MKRTKQLFLILLIAGCETAWSSSLYQGFTYQGRFLTPNGSEPMQDVVDLVLGIYSPDGNCLLYEERQMNIDLSQTAGLFSVHVGSEAGDPKRVAGRDPGKSLSLIFSNSGEIRAPGANCASGYTPAAGHIRKLRVTVYPHGGVSETMEPDLTITPVPQASVADTLQGLDPTKFVQLTGAVSSYPVSKSALDSLLGTSGVQDASSLHQHDSLYAQLGIDGSLSVGSDKYLGLGVHGSSPDTTGWGADPTKIGRTWFDSTTKEIKYWDGAAVKSLGVSDAGVASFNSRTGAVTLSSIDVTDALGFTPQDAADVGTDTKGSLSETANNPVKYSSVAGSFYLQNASSIGDTLRWDGSQWQVGADARQWSLNGADVYRGTGKVGIGLTNPSSRLDLGDMSGDSTALKIVNSNIGYNPAVQISTTTSDNGLVRKALSVVMTDTGVQTGGGQTYAIHAQGGSSGGSAVTDYGVFGTSEDYGVAGVGGVAGIYGNASAGIAGYFKTDTYTAQQNGAGIYVTGTNITTASLAGFNHSSSAFTGTMLKANMADGSGTFTGKFLDLQKNGTSQFTIDHTGGVYTAGSVGIGTSTPGPTVDINSSKTTSTWNEVTGFRLATPGGAGWAFGVLPGGTNGFVVQNTGKVLMGGDTAFAHTSIESGGNQLALVNMATSTGPAADISFLGRDTSWNTLTLNKIISGKETNTGGAVDSYLSFVNMKNSAAFEAMRVNSSGKLGIGTTNPSVKLDVTGAVRFGADGTACAGTLSGAVRYNAGVLELCNGTTWSGIASTVTVVETSGNQTVAGDKTFSGSNTYSGSSSFSGTATFSSAGPSPAVSVGGGGLTVTSGGINNSGGGISNSGNITGSSTASADLTIESTSNAAKGNILLAPAGGRVGIGVTNPSATLDVIGGARLGINATGDVLDATVPGSVYLKAGGTGNVYFQPAPAATAMTIMNGGNVGIGTTNPEGLLHLSRSENEPTLVQIDNPNSGNLASSSLALSNDAGSGGEITLASSTFALSHLANRLQLSSGGGGVSLMARDPAGDIRMYTGGNLSFKERLRITALGNVGIGTLAPLLKLDSRGSNPKTTTAAFENIFETASTDAANPLTLRMGIKTDATATNRYAAIEVDDAGTKRNLMLQPSGGNVGIGTTDPSLNLTVSGRASIAVSNVTTPWTTIQHSSGAPYSGTLNVFQGSSDTMGAIHAGIYGGGVHQYAIIGMRQNTSAWNNFGGAVANGDTLPGIGFAGQSVTGDLSKMVLGAAVQGIVDGAVSSLVVPTGIKFSTSTTEASALTERMRITSSGNVGIGTTNPTYILQVTPAGGAAGQTALFQDQTAATGNTAVLIKSGAGQTSSPFQLQDNAGTAIFSVDKWGLVTAGNGFWGSGMLAGGGLTTGSRLSFRTASNLTATSSSVQVVNIYGTFAPVSGSAEFTDVYLNPTINQTGGANGVSRGLFIDPVLTSASNFRAIETTAGQIVFLGGNVGIGTTVPSDRLHVAGGEIRVDSCVKKSDGSAIAGVCASDGRFKTDIEPLGSLLDRVTALRPVTYRWKAEEFPARHWGKQRDMGLIAQEAERALPELVETKSDGYKAVAYQKIPLLILQALKEFYERFSGDSAEKDRRLASHDSDIENLKADNAAKESAISELKSENEALKAAICELNPTAAFCKKEKR